MLSRISKNRTAGRLEGTHAFPRNRLPKTRSHDGFLDQIDITTKQLGETLAQGLQPAKMIEAPRREPDTRPDRQVHVGHPCCVTACQRAEERDGLDAARAELCLMRPQNRQ